MTSALDRPTPRESKDSWACFVVVLAISLSCLAWELPAAAASGSGPRERPGQPVDSTSPALAPDIDPLALTEPMKAFVDDRIGSRQTRRARLLRLQEAIFDPESGLGITYGSASTHTAAGTFEARSGNCLSFTLLFVALARHLDLDAYFIEVDEVTGWSQRGAIGFSHWHMYAEVELESSKIPVDFLPWTERRYRSSRRIAESRVRAHYHNNLGADLVAQNRPLAALGHFERAVALDRSFDPARVNMAVALRRLDREAEAERLLLGVLEAGSNNAVAAANLATLYVEQNRRSEAEKWLKRRERFLNRNPFHHFRLGMEAFDGGNYLSARKRFQRAISLQRDEAIFHEQLAETQLRLGSPRRARASLERAVDLTEDSNRKRALEARLQGLE